MFFKLATAFACIAVGIYFYFKNKYQYWKKRGVPGPEPLPIVGNYIDYVLMKKNLGDTVVDICKQFPDQPVIGAYFGGSPSIIVKDLDLLKTILTKDFYYFNCREALGHSQSETFTKNVFHDEGNYWRVLRQNMTPIFSSAKMKNMFYLIADRTKELEELLEVTHHEKQDIRTLCGRFTIDCIGSCIFGLETKVMDPKRALEENPFRVVSQDILEFSKVSALKFIGRGMFPSLFYALKQRIIPKSVCTFFDTLLMKIFQERNFKPGTRQDFVDLMLSLKQNKYIVGDSMESLKSSTDKTKTRLEVTDEMLIAQCTIFFSAGFETSASTMTYTLHAMAKHPELQDRLYNEVKEHLKKYDGKITYDIVNEMPFLDACVHESLRLHPVLGTLTRVVTENYQLPSGLVLEKGVNVHLPTSYIQRDPKYFPKPNEYNPERFFGENRKNIIPYSFFPFGEGLRICLGMRFAKMQMYAGLVTIINKYRLELTDDTPDEIQYNPQAFINAPMDGLTLKFIKRETA